MGSGPLPNFLQYDEGLKQFSVIDPTGADLGVYVISVIARTIGVESQSQTEVEMQIELEIASGCLTDEIYTSFSVDPITYLIGQTGVIEVSPTWSNTVAGCPSEYNVYRLDDGV